MRCDAALVPRRGEVCGPSPGDRKTPHGRRIIGGSKTRPALDVRDPEGPIPDRVTLLADVAEIVSRSHDLTETLGNVVDLVAKRLDADACSIYLIEAARARGNPLVDGLGMLLHQARPGFEAWYGVRPEVTPASRDFVLSA